MTTKSNSSAVQMSKTQFDRLIQTIRTLAPEPIEEKKKGSFANCKTSFYGQHDPEAVDEFIGAIEAYKELEEISDEDALKGLPLLLQGEAVSWWKGVRRQAKTWQYALELLRENFSPTKAPYQIYLEIFETKQGFDEPIDKFICKQRALLAKLPEGLHNEETELNFIYGLLALKYRERIPRHEISTFRDLLEKGRTIERHKN